METQDQPQQDLQQQEPPPQQPPQQQPPKDATPPADPPKQEEKPKVIPWVADIAKSLQLVIDPEVKEDEPPKDEKKEEPPAQTEEPPKVEDTPKEEPKKVAVKKSTADQILEQIKKNQDAAQQQTPPAQPPPQQPPPQPPPDDKKKDEEEFEAGLTELEKEELEFAKYAESKGHKGKVSETKNFLKKVQNFANENPDLTPESEDFKEFVERNKPRYSPHERKKLEVLRLSEETVQQTEARLKQEFEKKQAELNRKIHELETKPRVQQTVSAFVEDIVEGKTTLPEGIEKISPDVLDTIRTEGFDAASKKFPIEAPILQTAIVAAQEYVEIANGLKDMNPSDPTHNWLVRFIAGQERFYQQVTKPEERVVNGKSFIPRHKMGELVRSNPQEAAKHWTFNDADILEMIKINAHSEISNRVKELESAGFRRESKVKSQNQQPPQQAKAPTQTEPPPSPKAGTSKSPGAGSSSPKATPHASFLENLVPGSSKLV